jgi:hypothetical protein
MAKRKKRAKRTNPTIFPAGISYSGLAGLLGNPPKPRTKAQWCESYPSAIARAIAAALSCSDARTPKGAKMVVNKAISAFSKGKPVKKHKLTKKQLAALAKGRAKAKKLGYLKPKKRRK